MPSRRRLRLTAAARADVRSILRHRARRRGERQRDHCADALTAAMRRLASYPDLGRARDDVSPGLRGYPVGEHIDFYRGDDLGALVIQGHRIWEV